MIFVIGLIPTLLKLKPISTTQYIAFPELKQTIIGMNNFVKIIKMTPTGSRLLSEWFLY